MTLTKDAWIVINAIISVVFLIIMVVTFGLAVLSGGEVLVTVDSYGEMFIEMQLITFMVVGWVYSFIKALITCP